MVIRIDNLSRNVVNKFVLTGWDYLLWMNTGEFKRGTGLKSKQVMYKLGLGRDKMI